MKKLLLVLSVFASLCSSAQVQTPMGLPAHNSPFSGSVRGYYFTAPTCFTITGLEVPTDASTGAQSIAVVRFHSNLTPPFYSVTTNAFTVLYLTQNNPAAGIINVNIQVEQGDVIGILGQRATVNSYGTAGFSTTINGFPCTLNRLGMQYPLTTTAPQELWTETGGSISRVIMYYDPVITYNMTTTPTGPSSVDFSNGADSSFVSSWDFGDGSPLGTGPTPSHTYTLGGTYNVCSVITNSCGSDTLCTTVTVCGPSPAAANFSSANAGATVTFTDMSTGGSSMLWDFGDGNFSTSTNPSHTYAASGTYNVCQHVYNATCDTSTFCTSITVCIPPTVSFTTMAAGAGAIDFSGSATESTTYSWDFGDGSPLGAGLNPSHTYTLSGTYTVCVTAYGCDSITTCDTVSVCVPAMANFSFSESNGTVQFSNATTNGTSWMWDFGDATTDTAFAPSHTYTMNGIYNVCLTANGCESDTMCTTVTTCPEMLTASFTSTDSLMSANFTSTSTGSPVTYLWDFGDMTTSAAANPSHTFPTTGLYNVCLTTWNVCGDSVTSCDSVLLIITGVNTLPGANVIIYPNPAQESAVIDVNSTEYAGVFVFEMYDATGKLVRVQNGVIGQRMTIERSNISAGTYLYKIRTNDAVISNGKLIFTE